jgi:hypothetical protein
MAKKRKKRTDPEDIPSVRRTRELADRAMAELMARQGVSTMDELEMTPVARRMYELHLEGLRRRGDAR